MAYADYNFYTNIYKGTALSESEYEYLSERASDYIDSRTGFTLQNNEPDNFSSDTISRIKKACCSLSESIAKSSSSALGGVVSETVGDHAISYTSYSRADSISFLDDIILEYVPDLIKKNIRWI